MNPDVILGHLGRDGLQCCDEALQPVGVLLAGNQYRVLRCDHHEIVDTLQRNQRPVRRNIAVAGVLEHGGAARGVALLVLVREFPHRMPGADVGPAAGDRHNRSQRGLFHHGIVDRDRRRRAERVRIQRHETKITSGLRHRRCDRLHARGIDAAIFVEQDRRTEHEVAAVPEVARLDVLRRRRDIGLLDEFLDRAYLAGNRRAGADVAVLGGSALRLHAESHDAPLPGCRYALAAGGDESRRIAHHMIGGKREDHGILVAALCKGCTGSYRGPGVAAHRLEQDVGLKANLGELLEHHETVGRVGNDDRTFEQHGVRYPQQRVLKR